MYVGTCEQRLIHRWRCDQAVGAHVARHRCCRADRCRAAAATPAAAAFEARRGEDGAAARVAGRAAGRTSPARSARRRGVRRREGLRREIYAGRRRRRPRLRCWRGRQRRRVGSASRILARAGALLRPRRLVWRIQVEPFRQLEGVAVSAAAAAAVAAAVAVVPELERWRLIAAHEPVEAVEAGERRDRRRPALPTAHPSATAAMVGHEHSRAVWERRAAER